jgi:uncharacterized protein (DUF983 family)
MKLIRQLAYWIPVLWTGWSRRCPKCRQGQMFSSYYHIHKSCPNCNVTFQPYRGDELGVYAVSYFLSVIPALIAFLLAFKYTNLNAYGLLALIALVSGTVLFGLFPNMKGLWISLVYLCTGLRKRL